LDADASDSVSTEFDREDAELTTPETFLLRATFIEMQDGGSRNTAKRATTREENNS